MGLVTWWNMVKEIEKVAYNAEAVGTNSKEFWQMVMVETKFDMWLGRIPAVGSGDREVVVDVSEERAT